MMDLIDITDEMDKVSSITSIVHTGKLAHVSVNTAIPAGVLNDKRRNLPQSPPRSQRGFSKSPLCDLGGLCGRFSVKVCETIHFNPLIFN